VERERNDAAELQSARVDPPLWPPLQHLNDTNFDRRLPK